MIEVKKHKPNQPWLTADVPSAIKEKDNLWDRYRRHQQDKELKVEYRSKQNYVNSLVRSKKRQHIQEYFYKSRFDMSKTWSLVNDVKGCASKPSLDDAILKKIWV